MVLYYEKDEIEDLLAPDNSPGSTDTNDNTEAPVQTPQPSSDLDDDGVVNLVDFFPFPDAFGSGNARFGPAGDGRTGLAIPLPWPITLDFRPGRFFPGTCTGKLARSLFLLGTGSRVSGFEWRT